MSATRTKIYEEFCKDPLRLLELHFCVTPESDEVEVKRKFREFATLTGTSQQNADQAAQKFIELKLVADFVLQAASGQLL